MRLCPVFADPVTNTATAWQLTMYVQLSANQKFNGLKIIASLDKGFNMTTLHITSTQHNINTQYKIADYILTNKFAS